jgi:hypothetical protein
MGRGTAPRSGVVEGQDHRDNRFGRGVNIDEHLTRRDTNDLNPQRRQLRIAIDIARGPVTARVRFAIDLECEPGLGAIDVEDEASHRMLAPKLHDPNSPAEALP